jgi:hypothetical protein
MSAQVRRGGVYASRRCEGGCACESEETVRAGRGGVEGLRLGLLY